MAIGGIFSSGYIPQQLPAPIIPPRELLLTEETRFRWRHTTGLFAQLAKGWSVYQQAVIDSDPKYDPTNRMKEYRQLDASIEIPTAAIQYSNGPVTINVGRRWRRWGPGWSGSLILDTLHAPGDGLDISYTRPRWSARFFCERVNNQEAIISGSNQELSRYLSGHRLDIGISDNLRLGLSETILLAINGAPPFWAFNPLLPWAMTQQERHSGEFGANIFWSLDVAWNPNPSWVVYGQFLLDDFMIDVEDRDTHPDQLGWLVGAIWHPSRTDHTTTNNALELTVGWEYTRINTWTYVHRIPITRYQAWQGPIGHPVGPDSETATTFLEFDNPPVCDQILVWGQWSRRGRITLATPESQVGNVVDRFPSSPMNRSVQVGLSILWSGPQSSLIECRTGWSHISTDSSPEITTDDFWGSAAVTIPLFNWWSDL